MWQAISDIVIAAMSSGIIGITVIILIAWMVDRYFLVRDLKEQNRMMIDAFTANTDALSKLSTLIDQLCQRI